MATTFATEYSVGSFVKIQIPGKYVIGGYKAQVTEINGRDVTFKIHEPGMGYVTLTDPIVQDMSGE